MEFPVNMTGYAQGLGLFRCLCNLCGKEYFLHPKLSNLICDSGMCPVCDDLARQVDACHSQPEPKRLWIFRPVAPAERELKQIDRWGAFLVCLGLLALFGVLYKFSDFFWGY